MLVAVDEANRKLIVGLHQENVDRLLNDMPIEKPLADIPGMAEAVPDLAGWTLYILGPEDLVRLMARLQAEGVEKP